VPGCGKSLSAKAIASSWRLPLYRLDLAAVLGMYIGQSETQLREALETADRVAPCVLWIDEIEKGLASGGGDGGVSRRLVGQFLYWLQESTSKVFLVATANDVATLPPELLRKGRFDELFFVDLPEADERAEILAVYFEKFLSTECPPALMEDLVRASQEFSGSDLEAVVHDIATDLFTDGETQLPPHEQVVRYFEDVVPYSQTNAEDVAAIRMWGRGRCLPAGRAAAAADPVTGMVTGRRIVVHTSG
jgi:SpoVK/Ycf46/Vps4 family AAA+-type ATPase